jgi:hypothetical protein
MWCWRSRSSSAPRAAAGARTRAAAATAETPAVAARRPSLPTSTRRLRRRIFLLQSKLNRSTSTTSRSVPRSSGSFALSPPCSIPLPRSLTSSGLADLAGGVDVEACSGLGCRRLALAPQRWKIWGRAEIDDVALWDPRVGKENRETTGANCVLGMKIFLLHPQKLYIGDQIYSIC